MHPPYSTQEIAKAFCLPFLQEGKPGAIIHLLTDSRLLQSPELSLFFAIEGVHHDGHRFLSELYEQGVRHFVVSKAVDTAAFSEANFWLAGNAVDALQLLTAYHRRKFTLPVIGITGSNGKTIVKEWLFQLLHQDYHIVRSPKSFNSQIGVPLSVWQLESVHELAIFEAGISRMGEMEKLAPIIRCNIGLFTNIGEAHQEGFPSREEKIRQKLRLFSEADILIYCRDDEQVDREVRALGRATLSWSKKGKADIQIVAIEPKDKYTQIIARYRAEEIAFQIPFTDEPSIENALHSLAVLLYLGAPPQLIQERMPRLEQVAMRLEVRAGINDCSIINDSYNLDLTALAAALSYLNRQQYPGRRTLILSDILQSGEPASQLYAKVGRLVCENGIHRFIGIGKEIPAVAPHLPASIRTQFFPDTATFLAQQRHSDFQNEAILVKGARPFVFERIARRLSKQVHQTELEVDISALMHNIRTFQRLLQSDTRLIVMVKAAAYGSGSLEIARALEFHKVGYLAVAYADEGTELREGGIQAPILVLNPEEAVFDSMVRYQLEPELYSPRLLQQFGHFTLDSIRPLAIHLKLDTGMHRLGFDADNLEEAIALLARYPQLEVRSVFSHLAASEAPEHDAFTHEQAARFEALYGRLSNAIGYRPLRHLLNSSGIIRFPQYQMDMARLGIGAYGIDITGILRQELRTALTLRARISQIKVLSAGETVGYGRKGRISQPSRVATISIGYADGLPRATGNGRFSVLIRQQRAPIIGSVCMDMCMVDVTHIPQATEGDEVIIFGPGLPVSELAEVLGTIPYEVFTSVSPRVRRVYVHE
ncbi:MAG: bifunctional UDP-N-acetylmuramoyl-tripeptide:D-alanyl-D-alanine ligase/alanine racemase [Phaeodactylibacter sp.]|nr:bifunctional UDP-N-acetylmuramoyl-tripeptide:D-alanyl-D-alanine ligase/alanine racemase [Phaeodactylibacter sp.]MCB9299484.1 bifunctional UDP-N-acetylmuramoyl-tripeptide:D-alanyl-D-alanine ligase/alanine racemase [Lewinellaceae bacterium]